jgi:hypothetical protein
VPAEGQILHDRAPLAPLHAPERSPRGDEQCAPVPVEAERRSEAAQNDARTACPEVNAHDLAAFLCDVEDAARPEHHRGWPFQSSHEHLHAKTGRHPDGGGRPGRGNTEREDEVRQDAAFTGANGA